MKSLFFSLLLTIASMNTLSANEVLGCSLFSSTGELLGDYKITLTKSIETNLLNKIEIIKKDYYSDIAIYSKSSNEFLGTKIKLTPPKFTSFENWQKECKQSPLSVKNCSEAAYTIALKNHNNSPLWYIYPHQITEENEKYFLQKSSIVKKETLNSKIHFSATAGEYKVYTSQEFVDLNSSSVMNNTIDTQREVSSDSLKAKITFFDNALSYSLKIERKYGLIDSDVLVSSVACAK